VGRSSAVERPTSSRRGQRRRPGDPGFGASRSGLRPRCRPVGGREGAPCCSPRRRRRAWLHGPRGASGCPGPKSIAIIAAFARLVDRIYVAAADQRLRDLHVALERDAHQGVVGLVVDHAGIGVVAEQETPYRDGRRRPPDEGRVSILVAPDRRGRGAGARPCRNRCRACPQGPCSASCRPPGSPLVRDQARSCCCRSKTME